MEAFLLLKIKNNFLNHNEAISVTEHVRIYQVYMATKVSRATSLPQWALQG